MHSEKSPAFPSLLSPKTGHFRLESGHHSDLWIDLETLCLRPTVIRPFADALALRLAAHHVDAVCGPLNEGAFVALMVAASLDVEFSYAERFDHPERDALFPVEYRLPRVLRAAVRGRRVAIVNDVISAGSAVRGALRDLQACGATVVAIQGPARPRRSGVASGGRSWHRAGERRPIAARHLGAVRVSPVRGRRGARIVSDPRYTRATVFIFSWSSHGFPPLRHVDRAQPPRLRPVVVTARAAAGAAQPVALLRDALAQHRPDARRRIKAAAGHPSQFTLYIGMCNGGIWKTTDAGRTWKPIFDDQPTGSIGWVSVALTDPNIIYVGSGEGLPRPDLSTGDGIYKSTDAGKTWTHLGLRDAQQIPKIAVDPKNANRLFVAALGHPYGPNEERGIFRSTDGGRTFQKVFYLDENTGGKDVDIDPANPDIVYATMWEQRQGAVGERRVERHPRRHLRVVRRRQCVEPLKQGLPDAIRSTPS